MRESSIRSELLDLLPVVGHRFSLGRAALNHLVWLIRRTKPLDWRPGNRAVVFLSVHETAALREISTRQVNAYEQALVRAFGLSVTAPRCRRNGRRDPVSGRILTASGVELTGLHQILPDLRQTKAELDAATERRRQLRRELVVARGRARQLFSAVISIGDAGQIDAASGIMTTIAARVSDTTDLPALEKHIVAAWSAEEALKALLLLGKSCGSDVETSDLSEENSRHIDPLTDLRIHLTVGGSPDGDTTTRKTAGPVRETRPGGLSRREHTARAERPAQNAEYCGLAFLPPEATGAYMISPAVAYDAASDRFRSHLPANSRRLSVSDIEKAARSLSAEIGIGASAWREAQEIVGGYPAALCLLVVDQGASSGRVHSPGAYFRTLIRRALSGELRLHRSVYGFRSRHKSPNVPECPDAPRANVPKRPRLPPFELPKNTIGGTTPKTGREVCYDA